MTRSQDLNQDHIKTKLRRELRSQRSKLPEDVRLRHDRAIRQHLSHLIRVHKPGSVAAFWPFNGEPDITPLFEELMTSGCELALPLVSPQDSHTMQFHAWLPNIPLRENRYGIPEPVGTAAIAVADVDMLIVPLVAYDRAGNRLGMGGGYYDRHLEALRDCPKPLRVGIAYSLQQVEMLDNNSWDIPLHGLVNEHGWVTFVE